MTSIAEFGTDIDIANPIEVAPGVWWVGKIDKGAPLQCHAYLLDSGEEAILFEPGPLSHFPHVLNKVKRVVPISKIRYIVVSHQDPDVCGSIPLWEKTLESASVQIVTHTRTAILLQNNVTNLPVYHVDRQDWSLTLSGGRTLRFIFAPWCHCPGTFMTYDETNKLLFSGDIFGAVTFNWSFYADQYYPSAMRSFHDDYMASERHLRYAISKLHSLQIDSILPQHGSVINKDIQQYLHMMSTYKCGIDLLDHEDTISDANVIVENPDTYENNGRQGDYSTIIEKVIEREMGLLGKERVLSITHKIKGIFMDSEYNFAGINCNDGKNILSNLLKAFEEKFGFWAVLNCRLMIIDMASALKLELPDIMKKTVTKCK